MTTQAWHASSALLDAYLTGSLTAWEAASVEQHLNVCADCRLAVGPRVPRPDLDRAWEGVRSTVERPPAPVAIRWARRLGLPEPTAVLLTAAAALRTAWLSSSVVALGFAFLAAKVAGGSTLWPFLLVAPLVPVMGVAASYGPATDPLETLITTSPYGRTRLVLVRTLAVLTTTLPVAFLLGLLLPGPLWVAAAWLGPAFAMLPVMMAVATFAGPRVGAGLVSLAWTAVVVGSERRLPATWPVELQQQLVFLVVALAACLVIAVRSRATRQIGVSL